uniref:Uncharacterized protein n=1 Tax=Davidia involucrata TaxID=16924 RepID=A0A5B7AEX5_DAVIN
MLLLLEGHLAGESWKVLLLMALDDTQWKLVDCTIPSIKWMLCSGKFSVLCVFLFCSQCGLALPLLGVVTSDVLYVLLPQANIELVNISTRMLHVYSVLQTCNLGSYALQYLFLLVI